MINTSRTLEILRQGVINYYTDKPLSVSYEVTHSCVANCEHCDKGGIIKNEKLAPPERFAEINNQLKPLVAQVSGGEPLLRKDVVEIVKALKRGRGLPLIVFVTNGWLLNREKYLELKDAGVDEFSISLDFPDERHDENRRIKGLFKHLSELIPKLARMGNKDITMISVIRKETLHDLPALVMQTIDWGVRINFSAYSHLRTGDKNHLISDKKDLEILRKNIDELIELRRKTGKIFTSKHVFNQYYRFSENGGMPDCRAGRRFLVVNPDGSLATCAMFFQGFETHADLLRDIAKRETCDGCYISSRANTEKRAWRIIYEGVSDLLFAR